MTSNNILIGQVIIVLAIIVFGLWAATEWTAAHLGFQARLGLPWFYFARLPMYYPWRLFEWWYAYEAYAPQVFNRGGMIAASSGIAGAGAAIVGSIARSRQTRRATTFGSARWAKPSEVLAAGLMRPAGVFLGRLGDEYLRHDGPGARHGLCADALG